MIQRVEIGVGGSDRLPEYLRWSGAVLGLFIVGEIGLTAVLFPERFAEPSFLTGIATAIPFLIGLWYGGNWLRRSELPPSRYPRIAGWCLAGTVVFVVMNGALIVARNESMPTAISWLRWAVAMGGGISALIGIIEGRTIEQAVTAERAVVRSENLERQRDLLDYLNSTLRHEVLNSATIIDGYTARLLEGESDLDAESHRCLEIIREEADDMSTIVDDVRVLLQMTADDHELEPVSLEDVLTDELRKVDNRWNVDADLSLRTPSEDVVVRADEMLPRAFGNLLSNAVEHNDATTPRVTVTVERCAATDTVRVEITDNGSGLPEDERDSLFERDPGRKATHGLGLYLVDELLTRYGGTVELTETGTAGSTFTVELPCVSRNPNPDSDARPNPDPDARPNSNLNRDESADVPSS